MYYSKYLLICLLLLAAGCGGRADAEAEAFRAEVAATVEAIPTPEPEVIEVVRDVYVPVSNPVIVSNEIPANSGGVGGPLPDQSQEIWNNIGVPVPPKQQNLNQAAEPTVSVIEERAALQAQPSGSTPQLTVAEELVSVRRGPGVAFERIGMAERGESFEIVGKNDDGTWWQICCFEGAAGWMINQYITISGVTNDVAVSNAELPPAVAGPAIPQQIAPATESAAAPTIAPTAEPAAEPEPAWAFDLELQDQHLETNTASIYAWVHDGSNPLDGYFLRVTKDGQVLENGARSSALSLGTTRPTRPESGDNKIYNLKTDFNVMSHPGFNPAGTWIIQLVNGADEPVSPAVQFTLGTNETHKEMYVRFFKR